MESHAYVRVSSAGQSLDLQRHAIERAADLRGDRVSYFVEKRSANTLKRPVLDELRALVRAGKIRRLYVFRLDRLTRSGIKDTFELVEELRAAGCSLVTCSDGFDLDGPMAEPLIAMLAFAAKMEGHVRRERISAAYEKTKAAGKSWGRPRTCDDPTVQRILSLAGKGYSTRKIAVRVRKPYRTVGRVIQRALGQKVGPDPAV